MELVGISLIGVGLLFLFIQSMGLKGITVSKDQIGPAGFPQLVIILSLLLIIYILFTLMKAKKKEKSLDWRKRKVLIVHVFLFFLYLLFLDSIGFIFSTLPYSYLGIRNLGYSDKKKTFLFSLTMTASIILLFGRLFLVSLPRGIGVFRELSYFFY